MISKPRNTLRSLLLSFALFGTIVHAADPIGSGPEPAIVYSEKSLRTHTIYRPENLQSSYPVVLWGNGACVNSNFSYREFLAEVSSHGFIVLAIGPYRDSPAPRQTRPEDPAQWPPFETHYSQMLDALGWISAEANREDSLFYKKVNVDTVAVMGHSCGGLQTVKVSVDPRITTALVLNSGMMPDDDQYMIRHELQRSILAEMHAPIAYFIGGESDIAYANAEADWRELERLEVVAINANMDVGHGATYQMPNGGPFVSGPLAWLQWQLKGDPEAKSLFVGDECGFCTDSDWQPASSFPLTEISESAGAGNRGAPRYDRRGSGNASLKVVPGRTGRELFAGTKNYGLKRLWGTEIHVVLRTHGAAITGGTAEQIGTASGTCNTPSGTCANVFTSFHPPLDLHRIRACSRPASVGGAFVFPRKRRLLFRRHVF